MNPALLLSLLLSSLLFHASIACASPSLIQKDRVRLMLESPIEAKEPAFAAWVSEMKSNGNRYMLDSNSAFAKYLELHGDLTTDERTQLNYLVEVKPLVGSPNVWVALFYNRTQMNKSLIRSELFVHGGPDTTPHEIPSSSNLFMHECFEATRGLNLLGSEILRFWDSLQGSKTKPFPEEEAFFLNILLPIKDHLKSENFYLIGVNVAGMSYDTLGHEVAHGLFATDPVYKFAITKVWNDQVSASDKEAIKETLGEIYPDPNVLIDEFQAYLLQPAVPLAQSNMLAKFLKYQPMLSKALQEVGRSAPFSTDCATALEQSKPL
jgi:hypothetical protein